MSNFGYGSFQPQSVQKIFNNAKAFLFFLTLANIIQGISVNGLLKVNVTSIERRFNLLSSESGLIISTYDIAGCLTLLPVSYLGGRGHKPRWIGIGLLITSLGLMTLALPHFLSGPYTYSTVAQGMESENSSACLQIEASSNQTEELCAEKEEESNSVISSSLRSMKYIFMMGQFLIGVGSTPFAALSLTFLDDSVDPNHYPVYIGVYYLGALIGPAVGFILGGKLLSIFTELDVTPDDITTDSPQWVGAWWIGFVMCSVVMLLIAIPILGYPRQLRSTLTRKTTIADFEAIKLQPIRQSEHHAESSVQIGESRMTRNLYHRGISSEPVISLAISSEPVIPSKKKKSSSGATVDPGQKIALQNGKVLATDQEKVHPLLEEPDEKPHTNPPLPEEAEVPSTSEIASAEVAQQLDEFKPDLHHQKVSANGSALNDNGSSLLMFHSNRDLTSQPTNHSEASLDIIRKFFRDLLIIATNKAFVSLSLSAAVLGTIVSGFSTFGPKFVEEQFSRSASDAANVFGFIFLPASAFGLMLGSFLMSGLKLRHKKALQTCFVVSILGLLGQLIITLSCDDVVFAGINVPYFGESSVISNPPGSLRSSCNDVCDCPFNAYDPVCGENGITYYSPCYAACHSQGSGTDQVFSNCTCIEDESLSNDTDVQSSTTSSSAGSARSGKCKTSCRWQTLILIGLFFVVTTTFMCAIPGADLSLRCFPQALRSLSVGMQWILIRTLGTIPGPIIFGSLIDSSCVLWNKVDPCALGQGSCVLYKNQELSFSMLLLSMIFKGASVLLFGIAWLTYVPDALKPSDIERTLRAKRKRKSSIEPAVDG